MIIAVALIIGCAILVVQIIRFTKSAKKQFGLTPVSMFQLATDGEAMVKSDNGRVNILLLGVGGGIHEGPDLTDTIIVISFHLTKKRLALISIPRDVWSDSLKDRVNSAYHYGEAKKEGGGLTLSKIIIEDIAGVPIHYAMVIDFSQFETLIDYIGGIDVVVPAAFTDTQYPIAGKENDECGGDLTYRCRYQTLTFEKGLQHMDGSRALMYVRTRHAEGGDGNDFARGRRQQDVIIAVKTKILSLHKGNSSVQETLPGASVSIETELDPFLSKSDGLSGCVVSTIGSLPEISSILKMKYELFKFVLGANEGQEVAPLKTNEMLMLSINTTITVGMVKKIKGNETELSLNIPVVPIAGDNVGIARNINGHWRLIGFGEVLDSN